MVCCVSRCVIHLTLHFAFVLRLWSLYEPLANQTEDFLSWRYDLTVNTSVIFLLGTNTVNTRTWEPNISGFTLTKFLFTGCLVRNQPENGLDFLSFQKYCTLNMTSVLINMQCFISYCNLPLRTIMYCMYGARVYMVQHTKALLYELLYWFPFSYSLYYIRTFF